MVGIADEALHRPAQAGLQRAVDVEDDGYEWEQSFLRGCSATRPEAADFGRTLLVHAKGACKARRGRGSSQSPDREFPGSPVCRPAFRGGFLLYGVRVSRPRANRAL